MRLYSWLDRLGRPKSFLGKIFFVSFVGVHIPLIAVVVYLLATMTIPLAQLAPVLIVLLVATVVGTIATLAAIYALLAPVRQASTAIRAYLADKRPSTLPTHYPDQAGVLMADVQEAITRLDRALDAAHAAKERTQGDKEAKFELLSRMSHDLRTPLNHILGFSEMIQNEMLGPLGQKAYAGYAGDIRESGTALMELVQAMLEISEVEAGTYRSEPAVLDPAPLIQEGVALAHLAAERANVTIDARLEGRLPTVQADARAFKQVLSHYLLAVVRRAETGGTITVRVDNGGPASQLIISDDCSALSPDDTRYLRWRGSGRSETGAANENENEIDSASGFGLTLMLVHGLMRVQDGDFEIETVGDGRKEARFRFHRAALSSAA